jgi:hypothetical protein
MQLQTAVLAIPAAQSLADSLAVDMLLIRGHSHDMLHTAVAACHPQVT